MCRMFIPMQIFPQKYWQSSEHAFQAPCLLAFQILCAYLYGGRCQAGL